MSRFAALAIALTLLASSIAAPAFAQVQEIADRMTAFRDAYNAQDAAAVARLYTEEGFLMPQGGTPIFGRDSLEAFYAQSFAGGVGALEVQIIEIDVQGETAIEIGRTIFTLDGTRIVGRYLHVWKRVGGAWLIHRDIYNIVGQVDPSADGPLDGVDET